jgi:hypothetical protein
MLGIRGTHIIDSEMRVPPVMIAVGLVQRSASVASPCALTTFTIAIPAKTPPKAETLIPH